MNCLEETPVAFFVSLRLRPFLIAEWLSPRLGAGTYRPHMHRRAVDHRGLPLWYSPSYSGEMARIAGGGHAAHALRGFRVSLLYASPPRAIMAGLVPTPNAGGEGGGLTNGSRALGG